MKSIDQGTVIYGLRSEKYPEIMSYAIVISARCDIANNKISKLYYLTAVNAIDWFCTKNGFEEAYREEIKTKKGQLTHTLNEHFINCDSILSMRKEQALQIFREYVSSRKKLTKLIEVYEYVYNCINSNTENRRAAIKESIKPAKKFLTDASKGSIIHYFFIPQDAYLNNGKKDEGLIVDLQEIGIMQMNDANRLHTPGIDYQTLSDEEESERERLIETYWLTGPDDFVGIDGVIKSPWCELLMQRFSHGFIRVGVDGATEKDYEELVKKI